MYQSLASFATMPCVNILAWPGVGFDSDDHIFRAATETSKRIRIWLKEAKLAWAVKI